MADDAASEADSETVRGFPLDSGTDTESIASSRSTDFNRKKKEKQKAAKKRAKELAKAQAAAAEASAAGSSSSAAPEGVVVEYVSSKSDDLENPAFAEFASVFGKFAAAEDGQAQIVMAAQLREFWDQLLTYGCLVEDKLSIDTALWSWGKCEQEIYFSYIVMTHNNCCTHRCVNILSNPFLS